MELTGTGIRRQLSVGVVVEDNPTSVDIDETVFEALLPALYQSAGLALIGLAVGVRRRPVRWSRPTWTPSRSRPKVLFAVSQKAIGLVSTLVVLGLDFTAIGWGQVTAECLGIGALMAIPAIIEFLGHTMRHSLVVENLTGPLSWSVQVFHGEAAVTLPTAAVPARRRGPDPLEPARVLDLCAELHLLFVNTDPDLAGRLRADDRPRRCGSDPGARLDPGVREQRDLDRDDRRQPGTGVGEALRRRRCRPQRPYRGPSSCRRCCRWTRPPAPLTRPTSTAPPSSSEPPDRAPPAPTRLFPPAPPACVTRSSAARPSPATSAHPCPPPSQENP